MLLSRSAVEKFETLDGDFVASLERVSVPGGTVRRFPNGAVEVDKDTWVHYGESESWHQLAEYAFIPRLEASGPFRSLGPYVPRKFYAILYPEEYQSRLGGECALRGWRSTAFDPTPGEFELASLTILVVFRARLNGSIREAFLDAVKHWMSDASKRGAFEDGPVSLVTQGATFTRTIARFIIDASKSGQDTLNWLSLVLLDFGEGVHVVTEITYGHTEDEIQEFFPNARGEQTFLPFPEDAIDHAASNPEASRESFVPSDGIVDSSFPSVRFRVLCLPDDEWDSFRGTVYFERTPTPEERDLLRDLMDSWGRLCSYGGFGGIGSHSKPRLSFDVSTDSVLVECDMGDVDPELALPAFIRMLEGLTRSTGAPIEAVVFGRALGD
ncbi:hypothetical protein [Aquisphaera insulae]|uniref:hypothetical protein n=1 Tax=Aquisphaera insulae TaxID=2712864 RepID=UPI0013EBEFF1|nr:hypothetical protein [Aquisphaera insulae]